MSPDTLRAVGEALYGARWQTPLADDLGVADRTVRRWLAGTSPMPDNLRNELCDLIDFREIDLATIRKKL